MKTSTRLDSAVFQLTPTRTRCDLFIVANGKKEKIASGLLNPFLAHLKTAQEQMAKGGYSIILEPGPASDSTWFTRGTVERFVRFVSTPEILERVYTLESEILQIEEAISIQSNNDGGLHNEEDNQGKPAVNTEGGKPLLDGTDEKAIVLYKPAAQLHETNGSISHEGNSKVQLLKVLETRRTVLQKEQGMAFARAVAAGFEVDNMEMLIHFAECFGASRLMDACTKFIELWKRKHENGQWLEMEASEALSSQSDFTSMNASGIMLSDVSNKHKDVWSESHNASTPVLGGHASAVPDGKPPMDHQVPHGPHEYHPQQFPNPMYPPWPTHSPPGAPPMYQPYPLHYYQNYPANGPYFHPAYAPVQDPRSTAGRKTRRRRHSVDTGKSDSESEISEDGSQSRLPEGFESEEEASTSRKKTGRTGKKQSGMVVIRNINYITSKRRGSSNGEPHSGSDYESEGEDGQTEANLAMEDSNLDRSSKRIDKDGSSTGRLTSSDNNGTQYGNETDGGHWQAFEKYLLRDGDEEKHDAYTGLFTTEKEVQSRRKLNMRGDDSLALQGRGIDQSQQRSLTDFQKTSGKGNFIARASKDEQSIFRKGGQGNDGRISMDGHFDVQSTEINGRRVAHRRVEHNDFMIHGRENMYTVSSSDLLGENENKTDNSNVRASSNMNDDSYVVSLRSVPVDGLEGLERNAIDIDSEFPSTSQGIRNASNEMEPNYEPDYMSLMPERATERESIGYDPALDYEMLVQRHESSTVDKSEKEAVKRVPKKSDKDQKSKLAHDASGKKNVGPIRRGKPSKLSPLDEARARAERLRSYKADLQKMKKEKEEEQIKRLEALKIARQKRIAARSSSIPAQSPLSPQQTKKQIPMKISPGSHKGSKFSDAEPGSSSPLQRSSIKNLSVGSSEYQKSSKTTRLNTVSNSAGNRLSRSASSLPETMKESTTVTPDSKVSMARIRRLSEPRMTNSRHVSSVKPRGAELTRQKTSNGTDGKKISEILSLDRSKAATLPELKITKSTTNFERKSAPKEVAPVMDKNQSMASKNEELNPGGGQISRPSDADDNPIVEKAVVLLESERNATSMLHASQEAHVQNEDRDNGKTMEKPKLSGGGTVHPPIAPVNAHRSNQKKHETQEQMSNHEVTAHNLETSIKISSVSSAEKPYQAPYARVSSLEDPCTGNTEYVKALPTYLDTKTECEETVKAHISDAEKHKVEKMSETPDKQLRESSKGLRRLLKFGRKGSSSTTSTINEVDNSSEIDADEHTTHPASSTEVCTLKNLISHDETPVAVITPKKSSRPFSLLSPFRSKNSEKKIAT